MKLKEQEQIRMCEILFLVTGLVIKEFSDDENMITSELVSSLFSVPYLLDLITYFKTQKKTEEYIELKKDYQKIISNTNFFMKDIDITDPIGIFACYIYLYRNGYLSYNKRFYYDSDTKDLASLLGLDVIRGKAVCKNISSLLTDVYKSFGYEARNLIVYAEIEKIKKAPCFNSANLSRTKSGDCYSKIISNITRMIKIPNHAITMVSDDKNNYILDPTNDIALKNGDKKRLLSLHSNEDLMKNFMNFCLLYNLFGYYDDSLNISNYKEKISKPSISFGEYKELYLKALNICNNNKNKLDFFYDDNKTLYENIYKISENESSNIKRLLPVIPDFKRKN